MSGVKKSGAPALVMLNCGITVLLVLTLIYLIVQYPDDAEDLFVSTFNMIGRVFGAVGSFIGYIFGTMAKLPFVLTLALCGVYAWAVCVTGKLSKRKEKGKLFHDLNLVLGWVAPILALILFAKALQYNVFLAALVFGLGFFMWGFSIDSYYASKKVLRRVKTMREASAAKAAAPKS